ncbi:asparagine synthase-domain-containing protein [Lipomyces kononenkoae]|uniref:Asparagine synthase-domain-containing protein n=1 Tax=Lipomyces kononenkoae TaxID=34357 RepID=A0ACC3SWK9_LIPKO
MCGIFFSLVPKSDPASNIDKDFSARYTVAGLQLEQALKCRGPDCDNAIVVDTKIEDNESHHLTLFSTVLSMRDPLTPQPLQSQDGGILQFNGELYDTVGRLEEYRLDLLGDDTACTNDTALLSQLFGRFGVLETIQSIRGEYAFVYYDVLSRCIWWARDCIGRRSLLVNRSRMDCMALSSLPPANPALRVDWQEVPAGEVYKLDLRTMDITAIPWSYDSCSPLKYPYAPICLDISVSQHSYDTLVTEFSSILLAAVRRRVLAMHHSRSKPDTYAILFSGGIDCTLIAYLTAVCLRDHNAHIDLLNVAFENPRINTGFNTPDRVLGRRSWQELTCLPEIQSCRCDFRFVEINVRYSQVLESKTSVQELMFPKCTVMDFSIALAFYFAARGVGTMFSCPLAAAAGDDAPAAEEEYSTPSRVLMSGLGADELFAGYTRHMTSFARGGYEVLANELALDFKRLHERNLGRDDRVGANWSKEFRYPYLDEEVVDFALRCPLDSKLRVVGGENGVREGKWLLRQFARHVGLRNVAEEKKRAIQFGARSAKMEPGQGKIKGTAKFV